ncbi:hypothetical protein A0J57_20020 [Sphingobium sp. 22B]|uniref:hypothetical protein n=1 Tax=unclassified Sphingobium TaxID=2611147 RepID=UPI0007844251|nr:MULTISPECIES: hypothetical protein [unclassified Sphingobium]KXU30635.1 hypothetical protein AXW74_16615 [Sphingobium sp. AM]KYC30527.1 hypothetical protein A0J57_20020 [Sphingobium sp. 22B]OAP30248.1 hypothetical protein A8O16_19325 [Sphingobium sp. 20006FA]
MIDLTLTQFIKATSTAKPENVIIAPRNAHDAIPYTMFDVLDAVQENQLSKGRTDYFSFSDWDDGHSSADHLRTTLLYVEYEASSKEAVQFHLDEMSLDYYAIPTFATDRTSKGGKKRVDCWGFAIGLNEPLYESDTIRMASLAIEALECGGLTDGSYMPTYLLRLRAGQIEHRSGKLLSREFMEEAALVRTNVRMWIREVL